MLVPGLKEVLHVSVCVSVQFCGSRETQGCRCILEPRVKVSPPEGAAPQLKSRGSSSGLKGSIFVTRGFAGLATGLAFATEFQGDGTPHGHGFVSLANM